MSVRATSNAASVLLDTLREEKSPNFWLAGIFVIDICESKAVPGTQKSWPITLY